MYACTSCTTGKYQGSKESQSTSLHLFRCISHCPFFLHSSHSTALKTKDHTTHVTSIIKFPRDKQLDSILSFPLEIDLIIEIPSCAPCLSRRSYGYLSFSHKPGSTSAWMNSCRIRCAGHGPRLGQGLEARRLVPEKSMRSLCHCPLFSDSA